MKLLVRAYFQIIENGKVVGIKAKPENELLTLVEVRQENAIVLVDGSPLALPIEQSDLVTRLGGETAILAIPDDSAELAKPAIQPAAVPPTPPPLSPPVQTEITDELESSLLAKLAHIRSRWPKEIALRAKCDFPLFGDGRVTQLCSLAADTPVHIVSIEKDGVIVRTGKAIGLVRLKQTDLVLLMGGLAAIKAMPDDPSPVEAAASASAPVSNH